MSDDVYVTSMASSGPRKYHTDRECFRLAKVKKIIEKPLPIATDAWEPCKWCAAEEPPRTGNDDPMARVRALQNADPDTPLGGGA